MSKSFSGLFDGTFGISDGNASSGDNSLTNGKDFNSAGSGSVGVVDSKITTADAHNIPMTGNPNSVSQNYKDGNLDSERYYDESGHAYLDIDYTNHGNPKTHPHVPHEHSISFDEDGNPHRGKESDIK